MRTKIFLICCLPKLKTVNAIKRMPIKIMATKVDLVFKTKRLIKPSSNPKIPIILPTILLFKTTYKQKGIFITKLAAITFLFPWFPIKAKMF